MINFCKKSTFIFLLLFVSNANALENDWIEINRGERYEVFTRRDKNSSVHHIKAIAKMTGSLQEAQKIIFEVDQYSKYFPYIDETQVVMVEKKCKKAYVHLSPPIVNDRDFTTQICIEFATDQELKITWKSVLLNDYPPRNGSMRLIICDGYWYIKKINHDELQVEYYLEVDSKGNIPAFMWNKFKKNGVLKIVWALYYEMMKQRKNRSNVKTRKILNS